MKKYTIDQLEAAGYKIQNARIKDVRLSMADLGVLDCGLVLDGGGWGVMLGGYVLGKGYLGADEFEGSAKGLECIMRIMDTVGVEEWSDMKDKYVRVATKGWGDTVKIVGNVIQDKWFDFGTFFSD